MSLFGHTPRISLTLYPTSFPSLTFSRVGFSSVSHRSFAIDSILSTSSPASPYSSDTSGSPPSSSRVFCLFLSLCNSPSTSTLVTNIFGGNDERSDGGINGGTPCLASRAGFVDTPSCSPNIILGGSGLVMSDRKFFALFLLRSESDMSAGTSWLVSATPCDGVSWPTTTEFAPDTGPHTDVLAASRSCVRFSRRRRFRARVCGLPCPGGTFVELVVTSSAFIYA